MGDRGQQSLSQCSSAAAAKSQFEKKFKEKTNNQWSDRANFQPATGKYTMIERDYTDSKADGKEEESKEDEEDGTAKEDKKEKQSELDGRVQELVRLICDVGQSAHQTTHITHSRPARSHSLSRLPAVTYPLLCCVVLCCCVSRYDEAADG